MLKFCLSPKHNISVPCASLKSPSNQQQKQKREDIAIAMETEDVTSVSRDGWGGAVHPGASGQVAVPRRSHRSISEAVSSSREQWDQGGPGTLPAQSVPPLAYQVLRNLLIKAESWGRV